MTPDPWTKACLTAIALALLVLAFRPAIPAAYAQETLKCEITGGTIKVDSFGDELEVKVEAAFSSPGSSKSSPLYVEIDD